LRILGRQVDLGVSMGTGDSKSVPTLGFLTAVEHPQYGLFGGYLILNMSGRPLEFHCTAPIKPNRAQEILYGPTLDAFLYGEQIGQTLLKQSNVEPLVVCTDRPPALTAREFVSMPLVLVLASADAGPCRKATPADASAAALDSAAKHETDSDAGDESRVGSGRILRLDSAHRGGPKLTIFQLGCNRLAVSDRAADDRRAVTDRLAELSESFDLAEPFQRIREAIIEAQQAVR